MCSLVLSYLICSLVAIATTVQPFDLTTLRAVLHELQTQYLPARVEIVQQTDLWSIHFGLRTLQARQWVTLSWHPQAARVHGTPPIPKAPDPFQFSQALQRLKGLALSQIIQLDPWERVTTWYFARRPDDEPIYRLYLETMGKHSNAALVDNEGTIVACGRGVSDRQSSVRPLQAGLPYEPPPALLGAVPTIDESFAQWHNRMSWPEGSLARHWLQTYRGISRTLITQLAAEVGIDATISTAEISDRDWQAIYQYWQTWLQSLTTNTYQPGQTSTGYSILGWGPNQPTDNLNDLLASYYTHELNRQRFARDRHRLQQQLNSTLRKLQQRQTHFHNALSQSDRADEAKQSADLLMAHLHEWSPGMAELVLPDFSTQAPVAIALNPEKNAIANAQHYYKVHRKQKRARNAVTPLLSEVNRDIHYLEQVSDALDQLTDYQSESDLLVIAEVEQELVERGYSRPRDQPSLEPLSTHSAPSTPHCFQTPNGMEVRVGRNNRQNDWLTFKWAQTNDWWFHAQEIPGSHVLLRLPPGAVAEDEDVQTAADLAAYFSRAKLSEQVPVVYTRPKHVFKLKGGQPGMVTYSNQTVVWAKPSRVDLASGRPTAITR